jgi:beta-lactam-binding protein with PASTA domain
MRYVAASIGLAATLLLTACGGGQPMRVPDVRGERLDLAEHHLQDAGLDFDEVGGGALGVVVRSNWTVCDQEPKPGDKATTVRLIVDRSCPSSPVSPAPAEQAKVVPDLYGANLEDAKERLDALGISYDAENQEEPDDEPIVDHLWEVCDQEPEPGTKADYVQLYVQHVCDD